MRVEYRTRIGKKELQSRFSQSPGLELNQRRLCDDGSLRPCGHIAYSRSTLFRLSYRGYSTCNSISGFCPLYKCGNIGRKCLTFLFLFAMSLNDCGRTCDSWLEWNITNRFISCVSKVNRQKKTSFETDSEPQELESNQRQRKANDTTSGYLFRTL